VTAGHTGYDRTMEHAATRHTAGENAGPAGRSGPRDRERPGDGEHRLLRRIAVAVGIGLVVLILVAVAIYAAAFLMLAPMMQ